MDLPQSSTATVVQPVTINKGTGVPEAASRKRRAGIATWLAWSLWTLTVVLLAFALILLYVTNPSVFANNLLQNTIGAPAILGYATIGALIASRRARNSTGWLFGATALLIATGSAAEEYARYALISRPDSLPGGLFSAWLSGWLENTGFFLMFTFLLLLFPDGKLPSRRWRVTAWLVAASVVLEAIFRAFGAGPVTPSLAIDNPLGTEIITGIAGASEDLLIIVTIVVCLASVIVRFRHAKGDEHQQLKWFAYASVLAIAQFAARFVLAILFPAASLGALYDALLLLSIGTFPIAAGIAILKYRLYDIDLLVNRTLVYVPLTAILAGVYAASIALFQKLFVAATGEQSDAAVVITTLILVSSFTPIKNKLQAAVDKFFKEVPDPSKKLRKFSDQVLLYVQLSTTEQLAQRLLDEITAAFDCTGGAVYAGQPQESPKLVYASEGWDGNAEISVTPGVDADGLGRVALGARRSKLDYTPHDRETLQEIVDVAARAMELADHKGAVLTARSH